MPRRRAIIREGAPFSPAFSSFSPRFGLRRMKCNSLSHRLVPGYAHSQGSHDSISTDAPAALPPPATTAHHRRPRNLPSHSGLAPTRPRPYGHRGGYDARCPPPQRTAGSICTGAIPSRAPCPPITARVGLPHGPKTSKRSSALPCTNRRTTLAIRPRVGGCGLDHRRPMIIGRDPLRAPTAEPPEEPTNR